MNPSRRTLLKVGAAGGALLVLGGLGLTLQPTVKVTPKRPLEALDPRAFSILAAVAETLCPGGGDLPTASDAEVAEKIDALLHQMSPLATVELSQLLRLVENALAGFLLDLRPRPFTACSAKTRARVLEDWRTSHLATRRAGFKALCGLCNAAYWGTPSTWPHVGYPGPPDFSDQLQGGE